MIHEYRLRGSIGIVIPAIAAVLAPRVPEALTNWPQATTSPLAKVTLSILAPLRVIATTSLLTYSAPPARALRRSQSNMV